MAKTVHCDYELPDEGKTVKEEFETLRDDTLPKIDADMHAVMVSVAGKAEEHHWHEIGGINGLQTALDGKMASNTTFTFAELTDVVGVLEAPDGYVLVKVGDEVVMQSAASALGSHTHITSQIQGLGDVLAEKADASVLEGYVAYTEQSPSPEQQAIARLNIGAAKEGEVSEPVGSVTIRMGPLKPGCIAIGDGGTFSRTTYPLLAAWMDEYGTEAFALTTIQIASGELPDWRDYAPRTAGGALGPAVGAKQEDQLQGHTFGLPSVPGVKMGRFGLNSSGGTVRILAARADNDEDAQIISNGTHGTPRVGSETRGKSFGVRWQIRAAGAVNDSGTVNMLAVSSRVSELSSKAVQVDRANGFTAAEQAFGRKNLGLEFGYPFLHVVDEKSSGVAGGSSVAGVQIRTLNTVVKNEIPGAALSSSLVTLPAGTYWVDAKAPAYNAGRHKIVVQTVAGATLVNGTNSIANAGSSAGTIATASGRIVLATETQVRVSHYMETAQPSAGQGNHVGMPSVAECYAEFRAWKLK